MRQWQWTYSRTGALTEIAHSVFNLILLQRLRSHFPLSTSKESQLCFANKLANFCRCLMFFFAGPAVWTNHLQVRFAEMPLPAHFAVELLQFWFKQHACPLSCGCSLFRNEGARDFHSDSELK
jgi:hypothetical protein